MTYLFSKKKSFLQEAMKYLHKFPHFAAVARCSNFTEFVGLTIDARICYAKWKRIATGSSMFTKSINSIDDEAAEMILILSRIQWCEFIRISFHKKKDLLALVNDFAETSYFKERLAILQKRFGNDFTQTNDSNGFADYGEWD